MKRKRKKYRIVMHLHIIPDSLPDTFGFPTPLYLETDDEREALEWVRNAWAQPGVTKVELEQ